MIIAMMSNTYEKRLKENDEIWKIEIFSRIIRYEKLFPELWSIAHKPQKVCLNIFHQVGLFTSAITSALLYYQMHALWLEVCLYFFTKLVVMSEFGIIWYIVLFLGGSHVKPGVLDWLVKKCSPSIILLTWAALLHQTYIFAGTKRF